MGWGHLFFGYFLTFLLGLHPTFAIFSTVPGCLFMLFGLKRLSLYCRSFHYALWCAPLMAAVSIGGIVGGLLTAPPETATAAEWLRAISSYAGRGAVAWLDFAAVLLFHAALALAIKEIATRVGVPKNAVRAVRNFIIVGLWAVCFVLTSALPADTGKLLTGPAMLMMLIWAFCNCILLYSCYMRIAPAEQAEEQRKPSRFAWVNRMRDAYEEKTQKAIDADRAYHAKNARERMEKRQARMSEKQRRKENNKQNRSGK